MGSRGGFAFNVSGSAVGTAKPVSRGGQRAGHRAGVSHQSFDDRRGGTAPAKTSGADFEPSWHLDLGGLLNGGEKRSPAAQSSGNESGSAGAGAGGRDARRSGTGRSLYGRGNDVRSASEALRYATAAYGQPARRNASREGGNRASRSQQFKRGQVAGVVTSAQKPPQTAPVRKLVDSPYGDALARPGTRPGSRKPSRFVGGPRSSLQGGPAVPGESLSVRSSWNASNSNSSSSGGGGTGSRGDPPSSRARAQAQRQAQAKAQREAQGKVKTQRDSLLNDSDRVDSVGDPDATTQSTNELHERQRHIDSMSPTKIQASELPGSAGPRRSSTAARTTAPIEHFPVRAARVDSDSDSDLDDQLGGEVEVSEETFSKQPRGYTELGRPTTAHRAERPSTAGLMGESTVESDRPGLHSDRSPDTADLDSSSMPRTTEQRYRLASNRWRSFDTDEVNPDSARQWVDASAQKELGPRSESQSSSSSFNRRVRSAAAISTSNRNTISPTELEDRPPSRGKAPPEALYLSGTLTSDRSMDKLRPARLKLADQETTGATHARSASQPLAGARSGGSPDDTAGRSAFTTVPPASALAVPTKQPSSAPNSARSLPASALGYQEDLLMPQKPSSSTIDGQSTNEPTREMGPAGAGSSGDDSDEGGNLLFQKRPPSRQKPPPDALHLDLPPRHFVGGAHIERPPTASSKRRPQRARTAGPLRNRGGEDANSPFSIPGVRGGQGGAANNRPLSGFGRPTTRQELEELMGPLSRTELASAQVSKCRQLHCRTH